MHYWWCLRYAKQSKEPLWSLMDAISPAISLRFSCVSAAPGGKSHKFLLDHFFLLSFFFFPIKEILPKDPLFCYLSFSVTGKEGERMRREEVIVILWVITERLKIKQGNLLPINYIFMRHSYHQNWIYMQNDAACVGTGGLIAKHGQVSYANCAHFPTNLKWLSLHPYSYNALIT